MFQAHGLLRELSEVFAAAPKEVAAKVNALLNPPETSDESAISVHVRPDESPRVRWDGVFQCVSHDSEGGFLFLPAMLCRAARASGMLRRI